MYEYIIMLLIVFYAEIFHRQLTFSYAHKINIPIRPAAPHETLPLSATPIYIKTWSQSVTRSTIERPSHCPDCQNEQR